MSKNSKPKKDIVVVKGWSLGTFIKGLILGLIVGAVAMFLINKQLQAKPHTSDETDPIVDGVVEEHFTGFTAVDFENAVLGESEGHKELIVMEQPVQFTTKLSQEGPWEWEIFRKTKAITYHGTGVYTVDLSNVNKSNIAVDENAKTVKVTVPHAVLQYVNPDFDKIEFEDTEKGLLAFTDIKLTAEQQNELEKAVLTGMEEVLSDEEILSQADDFANIKVWELFQPAVSAVSPEYKVEVEFN